MQVSGTHTYTHMCVRTHTHVHTQIVILGGERRGGGGYACLILKLM